MTDRETDFINKLYSKRGRIIKVHKKLLKRFLKLFKLWVFAVGLFTISLTLIYLIMPRVIDVLYVSEHPEAFKGKIGVVGEVFEINDDSSSFLLLHCGENTPCITIPVTYKGKIPEVKSKIIVYGKIKLEEGYRFIETFEAYKIYARKDDIFGSIFYTIRKAVREGVREVGLKLRRLLYSNCKKCLEIKKRLIPDTLIP